MDTSDRIVEVSVDGGTMGMFVAQPTAGKVVAFFSSSSMGAAS